MARQYRYRRTRERRTGAVLWDEEGYVEAGTILAASEVARALKSPSIRLETTPLVETLLVAAPDGAEISILEFRRRTTKPGRWGKWGRHYG